MKRIKKILSKIDGYKVITDLKLGASKLFNYSKAHGEKAWLGGVAAMGDFSQYISQTDFVSKLNTYKSEVSEAMDSGFKIGAVDLETGLKMMPNNHRILDGGHGFFESIQKAREVGEANGWSDAETFKIWLQSYFTDMSSPAGMPVLGKLTDDVYEFLRSVGFSEETARDLITVNGQEAVESLLGGTLSAVGLILAWKKEDKDNFSRALGSIGLAGAASMNPVVLTIVVVAAALGYNTLVCHKAVTRGALVGSTAMLTSLLIPGPLLLGVIPGIVFAIYVNNKMGKDFDLPAQIKIFYVKMKDSAERARIISSLERFMSDLKSGAGIVNQDAG